jgi:hypothetical protein
MSLLMQIRENGIGDASISHLKGLPIPDETGDIFPDLLGRSTVGFLDEFQDGLIVGKDEVYIFHMDEAVTVDARHVSVHLSDYQRSLFRSGFDNVNAHPQTHVAVLIGRRGLDESHVNGHKSAVEEVWNVGEKDRSIIGQSLIHGFSGVVRDEKRVVSKIPFEFFICIGGNAKGPYMEDFGIEDGRRMRFQIPDEGTNQILGLPAAGPNENSIASVNMAKDPFLGDEFLWKILSPRI